MNVCRGRERIIFRLETITENVKDEADVTTVAMKLMLSSFSTEICKCSHRKQLVKKSSWKINVHSESFSQFKDDEHRRFALRSDSIRVRWKVKHSRVKQRSKISSHH